MNPPALSAAGRASATPCLVRSFDELHGDGNATVRNMIDRRAHDPDNVQAVFDAATPAPKDDYRRVLCWTVGVAALSVICFVLVLI